MGIVESQVKEKKENSQVTEIWRSINFSADHQWIVKDNKVYVFIVSELRTAESCMTPGHLRHNHSFIRIDHVDPERGASSG
jgi:hypothetical protein